MSSRPTKLDTGIESWLGLHPGWARSAELGVVRTYDLGDFPRAVAFAVRLALLAEKHNHHPDIDIRFKTVRVQWVTHDAGGLTRLDLTLAEASDAMLA